MTRTRTEGHGSARTGPRRGSMLSAGSESMNDATKADEARAVASGKEMPPAVAGRSSWKAVRVGESRRSVLGLRRRTAAMARTADVLAEAARVGMAGDSGEAVVVMVGGDRRKWWLKVVWGRRQRMIMRRAP